MQLLGLGTVGTKEGGEPKDGDGPCNRDFDNCVFLLLRDDLLVCCSPFAFDS